MPIHVCEMPGWQNRIGHAHLNGKHISLKGYPDECHSCAREVQRFFRQKEDIIYATAKSDQMANAASWFAALTSLKEACDP